MWYHLNMLIHGYSNIIMLMLIIMSIYRYTIWSSHAGGGVEIIILRRVYKRVINDAYNGR